MCYIRYIYSTNNISYFVCEVFAIFTGDGVFNKFLVICLTMIGGLQIKDSLKMFKHFFAAMSKYLLVGWL